MNANKIKQDGLCIQCGGCVAQCPKGAISIEDFEIQVSEKCNNCGLCLRVCPVNELNEYKGENSLEEYVLGEIKEVINIKARDKEVIRNSASGGFISTTVKHLLDKGKYESAYLVEGYNYEKQIKTKRFIKGEDITQTAKSRYLPVSHSEAFSYIKAHKQEKVILVCTPCCVNAFNNFVKLNNLDRNNYLIIGLFCDRTLNYKINKYFSQHPLLRNKKLSKLYFRTKEALEGNWPGHVRICCGDNTYVDLDRKNRMEVKDYFIEERCLYCVDKLNREADISAGDNYIDGKRGSEGSNTIVIRTKKGEEIFKEVENLFEYSYSNKEALTKAQGLSQRKKNYEFAKIKGIIEGGSDKQHKKLYKEIKRKMKISQKRNLYSAIQLDIKLQNIKNKIKKIWYG